MLANDMPKRMIKYAKIKTNPRNETLPNQQPKAKIQQKNCSHPPRIRIAALPLGKSRVRRATTIEKRADNREASSLSQAMRSRREERLTAVVWRVRRQIARSGRPDGALIRDLQLQFAPEKVLGMLPEGPRGSECEEPDSVSVHGYLFISHGDRNVASKHTAI
ncbi:hypothetical protein JTB14_029619 [Gonioctena quinquepunctata]|nr:hypothetical protein JTB14_029619 [Gonioctena quinquepunctata]